MKLLALVICIFCVIPTLPAQDYQPDSTAYEFIFYMPRGWKRMERPDSTALVAPLSSPNVTYIALLPPVDSTPDLRGVFNARWQGVQRDNRVLQGGQATSQHFAKGYDAIVTTAILSDRNGQAWVVFLMVAQNGAHAETLIYMSNAGDPGLANALQEVLHHVIDSLGFSGGASDPKVVAASKPVGLPKGKGNLNGIYRSFGVVSYGPMVVSCATSSSSRTADFGNAFRSWDWTIWTRMTKSGEILWAGEPTTPVERSYS